MKAAVVTDFDTPPRYGDFPLPDSLGTHEIVVDVLAAGLHPRVRSQATGRHYTSEGELPLVPGIDGVGRDANGALRYFILPDTTLGSMAERTVIDERRSVVLPEGADAVHLAAAMNPAMSSWLALRHRASFTPGQSVLVFGATGNAGTLAVQVARYLGAGRVTVVGRGADRLAALHADDLVDLEEDDHAARLGDAAKDVDVVLDYLWGEPTRDALYAIVPRRSDDSQSLTWVQIGSAAGLECAIPSAALRATRLQIVGSGQGSVATRDIIADLGELAEVLTRGALAVETRVMPLRDVEKAWADAPTARERIVISPTS